MKIFIAGAKAIHTLSPEVKDRMMRIYCKGYDVLVGDCSGVDSSVQEFYSDLKYPNVVVYASNGKARNNIGHWTVKNVAVPSGTHGFDFYKQKDIAMANDANYGFMIWDGKSKGTLNNIINLVAQHKKVLVYLSTSKSMLVINNVERLKALIAGCEYHTQVLFQQLNASALA